MTEIEIGTKATCRYCGHEVIYEPWFRDGRGPNPPVWSHTHSGTKTCSTRPVGWAADQWPFAEPASRDSEPPAAGVRDAARQTAGQPAVADCPSCEVGIEHTEHCPTPETHNWGCGCPTDERPVDEPQFGVDGCTCRPWTNSGDGARWCTTNDTIDMISGWDRRRDCPHHKPAAVGQQDATQPTTAPSTRNVIEHALTTYYQDSSAPSAIARALLAQHRTEILREAADRFDDESKALDLQAAADVAPELAEAARHQRTAAASLRRLAAGAES